MDKDAVKALHDSILKEQFDIGFDAGRAEGLREGERAERKRLVERFEWWKQQTGEDPPWQIIFVDDIRELRPEDLAAAVRLANEDRRRKRERTGELPKEADGA